MCEMCPDRMDADWYREAIENHQERIRYMQADIDNTKALIVQYKKELEKLDATAKNKS